MRVCDDETYNDLKSGVQYVDCGDHVSIVLKTEAEIRIPKDVMDPSVSSEEIATMVVERVAVDMEHDWGPVIARRLKEPPDEPQAKETEAVA